MTNIINKHDEDINKKTAIPNISPVIWRRVDDIASLSNTNQNIVQFLLDRGTKS